MLKPKKFPFPVISIGGISAGGTGKTPLTSTVIEIVLAAGGTPVLFSRGYGRTSHDHRIVSPLDTTTYEEVGDEPLMLKEKHPPLWLAIGSKRVRTAQLLLQDLPPKAVAILDDGFQHRFMHRDLDIVTLPHTLLEESLIPSGLLREPLSALRRADLLISVGHLPLDQSFRKALTPFPAPLIEATPTTPFWKDVSTGKHTSHLTGKTGLFSGIARPQRFVMSASQRCDSIALTKHFSDHHPFSDDEISALGEAAVDQWGTTEKDLQRISVNNRAILKKLYYLEVKISLDNPTLLESLIASQLRGHYGTTN